MPGISLTQAKPPFILAIDIGTSSVRALLYDASCRIIEPEIYFGRAQVALQTDVTGMAVFEPLAVPKAVVDVVDSLLEKFLATNLYDSDPIVRPKDKDCLQ
jgi:sugar (pentulose or hexulose) kinase